MILLKITSGLNRETCLVILVFFILIVCSITFVMGHEEAHKKINDYNGIDSNVEYYILGAHTVSESPLTQEAIIGHGINESIGYQLAPLLVGIMALQAITLFVIMRK